MKTSKNLIESILKKCESLHDGDLSEIGLQPKMDCQGIWTEGWGHAIYDPVTKDFVRGQSNKNRAYALRIITNEDQADATLLLDLKQREDTVNSLGLQLNQNQFDALVDFCYNVGSGNLQSSTLLKTIKDGTGDEIILLNNIPDDIVHQQMIKEKIPQLTKLQFNFVRWCRGDNKNFLLGLWKRRILEYQLFVS